MEELIFHLISALKATFSITVVAPKDRVVLSNMPEVLNSCLSLKMIKIV